MNKLSKSLLLAFSILSIHSAMADAITKTPSWVGTSWTQMSWEESGYAGRPTIERIAENSAFGGAYKDAAEQCHNAGYTICNVTQIIPTKTDSSGALVRYDVVVIMQGVGVQ